MQYVYGPVPSRRLGRSLGIDTVPLKTCNWNCVYCQLGRSAPMVHERRRYVPTDTIVAEAKQALEHLGANAIDWVTFVASGEGTLHSKIGRVIRAVKALTDTPIAVITNGSLLYREDVREELAAADAVLPTLDAGDQELYQQINRPHPSLGFEQHLEGLETFSHDFAGKIWMEVMLIRGLNDSELALCDLAAAIQRIRVDEVHLVLPTRPPAEPWLEPADGEGLMRAQAILGDRARPSPEMTLEVEPGQYTSAEEAIVSIVTRHPMIKTELHRLLHRWTESTIDEAVAYMIQDRRIQRVLRHGREFIASAKSRYAAS